MKLLDVFKFSFCCVNDGIGIIRSGQEIRAQSFCINLSEVLMLCSYEESLGI